MKDELIKQWKYYADNHVAKTNQDVTALNQLTIDNAAKNDLLIDECKDLKQDKEDQQQKIDELKEREVW